MRSFCKELFDSNQMKIGAPYTPLPLEGNALFFPSTLGGGNWGGVSVDPSLGLLFVNVMHIGQWGHMEKRGRRVRADIGVRDRTRASGIGRRDIPCQNPPFGEMVAVDLASGDIAWRSPLGRIEALEAIGVRDTGTLNLGGSIATAGGLVFIGATNDSRFRAFDSKTGKAAVGNEAGSQRPHQPDDIYGPRRPAVCRADGGRGEARFWAERSAIRWWRSRCRMFPESRCRRRSRRRSAAAAAARRGTPKVGSFAPGATAGGRRARRWWRRPAGPGVIRWKS